MIIDTHTHFYDPSRPQGVPWPRPSEAWLYRPVLPAHYRALAAPIGITGTVVVEASAWVEDNQWLLDLARKDRFLLGIVGNLDPRHESFPDNLGRFAADPLFRGIRCGAGTFGQGPDGLVVERLGLLAERGLTLDAHVGAGHLAAVAELARRLPSLRIVVNHLALPPVDGGPPPADWRRAVELVAAQPGVFMKVSAFEEFSRTQPAPTDAAHYTPVFDAVWEAFGPERLLYGSNWPCSDRSGTLASTLAVVKDYVSQRGPAAAAAVLAANACRAYGVAVRPAAAGA